MRFADRRAELIDSLADFLATHGLAAASLRPLAEAAGTSDRMLLYYFADKTDIITAALSRIAERLTAAMESEAAPSPLPLALLRPRLAAFVLHGAHWPYMRLGLELASLAAQGDAVYRAVGEQILRGFLAWGAAQLDSPTPAQRAVEAAQLLVELEGLLVLKALGLRDVAELALSLPPSAG